MKRILNPYAPVNPRELLPAKERKKLNAKFEMINPNKNIFNVQTEESNSNEEQDNDNDDAHDDN